MGHDFPAPFPNSLLLFFLVCTLGAGLQEGEVVQWVHQPTSWHQVSNLDLLYVIVNAQGKEIWKVPADKCLVRFHVDSNLHKYPEALLLLNCTWMFPCQSILIKLWKVKRKTLVKPLSELTSPFQVLFMSRSWFL